MKAIEQQLLGILQNIKGSGSFASSNTQPFVHPKLIVEDFGELGFPLNKPQIKGLIEIARQSPFGKGSETITDTTVRKTWEIDADQLSFKGKDWEHAFEMMLEHVQYDLGILHHKIKASLYKLLIYEEGGFFLPHKDSEKEKGMFGTMVIGLPSTHTGGELVVRFGEKEKIIAFSDKTDKLNFPYAAFYADCEHEIKPVTSGYRVCLVYNLIQKSSTKKIKSPQFDNYVAEVTELLTQLKASTEQPFQTVLLGHEYTPENFSLDALKLDDAPRAEVLFAAADKAGYFAQLGLVTHYQMGDLEGGSGYDDYWGGGRSRSSGKETMGDEIYEEYTTIEHWAEGNNTIDLGSLQVEWEEMITDIEIGDDDPTQQEAEGYTGNAGMTMTYWYHYGAIVFWAKDQHFRLLQNRPTFVKLKWLRDYTNRWKEAGLNAPEYSKQLLQAFTTEELQPEKRNYGRTIDGSLDYGAVTANLLKQKDGKLLEKVGINILPPIFKHISIENWRDLFVEYGASPFKSVFKEAGLSGNITTLRHLLATLHPLIFTDKPKILKFVEKQVENLPDYLLNTPLHEIRPKESYYRDVKEETRTKKTVKEIISEVLVLSQFKKEKKEWANNAAESITKAMPRDYVNTVVLPVLLSKDLEKGKLFKYLHQICIKDFEKRTKDKPQPPADWAQIVPESNHRYNKATWDILRAFIESPTEQIFLYKKPKNHRSEMERTLSGTKLDIKMETLRTRPSHTLQITKTQTTYHRLLTHWEEDVVLLGKLREVEV